METLERPKLSTGWMSFLGVVQIVTGILAITLPLVAGLALATVLGIVLCVAGGFQLFAAFSARSFGGGLGGFFGGVLYLLVGILCFARPDVSLKAITLFAAMMLIFRGFLRIGISLEIKPEKGWGWVLFGGLVAAILGILVIAGFPTSAAWFVGTVVGVELLFSGWSLVFMAMAVKDLRKQME